MGTNFHTAWIDGTTTFNAASMNPATADLDRAISYLKNIIVHCDGIISYNSSTGVLTWSDVLRILFIRTDGYTIQNTISANSVTLTDNQFAYVDLSETNNAALTAAVATVTTGAASNFVTYNRLVLGYRNTASDKLYSRWFIPAQAHLADAKADYTTGDLDTEAEIISAINATNAKINSILVVLEKANLLLTS